MTKLILAPFDPAAPGSHRQRIRQLELGQEFEGELKGAAQLARYYERVFEVLKARLRTDDGTPVEQAMAEISVNDYEALIAGMWRTAEDTVPLASTAT